MEYVAHVPVLVSLSVPQEKPKTKTDFSVALSGMRNLLLEPWIKGQMMYNILHASVTDIQAIPHIGSECKLRE